MRPRNFLWNQLLHSILLKSPRNSSIPHVLTLVMFQGVTMEPSAARAAKDFSRDPSENSWATNAVETKNVK